MATVYELRDAYPHANSGDPGYDPKPPSKAELENHFYKFMKDYQFDDDFEFADFQGPHTQKQLADIGATLLSCYEFDRSEHFGE